MSREDVHELKINGDGFKFHHGARVKSHVSSCGHKIMLIGPSGKEGSSPGSPLVIDPSVKIQAAAAVVVVVVVVYIPCIAHIEKQDHS